MRVRLLGRVEVHCPQGRPVGLTGARRRAVLSLLASELNGHVTVDRLLDTVWEGAPPPTARAALQGHVSAVRRSLCEGLTLLTRAQGYVLVGEPDLVDAKRFERLSAAAEDAADTERSIALLREALDLWDGPALSDCGSRVLTETAGRRLDTARALAVERLAERLLTVGRGADALDDLQAAVAADPLREPAAALLIRCLHQAGRPADARLALARFHERLASRGLAPGHLLRQAADAVAVPAVRASASAAPPAPAPGAALPRTGTGLVGRAVELRRLDEAARRADGRPVLVTGVAGAGKTSLVLHWAHARADRFPDGRVHVDLRGFGEEEPLTTAEALDVVLARLGVPAAERPADPGRAGALLRKLTEGRRLLLVLDGARSAEQVEPLLPCAPEPVVVITSRSRLTDLVVSEAAIPLPVGGLPEDEAVELLGRVVGAERVAADPAAARRLAALCDRLPLALRVAGARLASRPGWVLGDVVHEMSDERTGLAALATGGALGIAAALGRTVRALPAEARRLFALSGLHPGGALDSAAGAALADVTRARARELLAELDAAHLVQEASPGRFRSDRLARLYAAELAAELPAADRAAAVRRLLDHTVDAATAALAPLADAIPPQSISARAFETAEQELELARRLVGELTRQVSERATAERETCTGPGVLVDRLSRTLAGIRPAPTPEPWPDHAEPDPLDRLLADLLRAAPEVVHAKPAEVRVAVAADARTPGARPGGPPESG
ncbi:BTAD domain-containing putative transcriptional regulator [Kitasatospora sp. NPDC059408]|uniref:AfsR/SARP family transcriptional regulator n=1 Tax=Kitasatospora sp. NPDC059408 TaxID=3346823 RepID=UPI0036C5809A